MGMAEVVTCTASNDLRVDAERTTASLAAEDLLRGVFCIGLWLATQAPSTWASLGMCSTWLSVQGQRILVFVCECQELNCINRFPEHLPQLQKTAVVLVGK